MAPLLRLLAVGFHVLAILSPQTVFASEDDGLFSVPINWKGGDETTFAADMAFGSQHTSLEVVMDLGSQFSWVRGARRACDEYLLSPNILILGLGSWISQVGQQHAIRPLSLQCFQ